MVPDRVRLGLVPAWDCRVRPVRVSRAATVTVFVTEGIIGT